MLFFLDGSDVEEASNFPVAIAGELARCGVPGKGGMPEDGAFV